jgi:hypothetical protein
VENDFERSYYYAGRYKSQTGVQSTRSSVSRRAGVLERVGENGAPRESGRIVGRRNTIRSRDKSRKLRASGIRETLSMQTFNESLAEQTDGRVGAGGFSGDHAHLHWQDIELDIQQADATRRLLHFSGSSGSHRNQIAVGNNRQVLDIGSRFHDRFRRLYSSSQESVRHCPPDAGVSLLQHPALLRQQFVSDRDAVVDRIVHAGNDADLVLVEVNDRKISCLFRCESFIWQTSNDAVELSL